MPLYIRPAILQFAPIDSHIRIPPALKFILDSYKFMTMESVELPNRLAILPFRNKLLLPGAVIRIRCTSPSRCSLFSFHFSNFWWFFLSYWEIQCLLKYFWCVFSLVSVVRYSNLVLSFVFSDFVCISVSNFWIVSLVWIYFSEVLVSWGGNWFGFLSSKGENGIFGRWAIPEL